MSGSTIPEEFRLQLGDSDEVRERKFEAFTAWSKEQAEGSREGAINHVTAGELHQPLLRYLSDAEVTRVDQLCREMAVQLRCEGMDGAAIYVAATLQLAARNEQGRRVNEANDLRIMVEANGHEVSVVKDGGHGWYPMCSCEAPEFEAFELTPDREPAAAAAAVHAAEHGGAWSARTD